MQNADNMQNKKNLSNSRGMVMGILVVEGMFHLVVQCVWLQHTKV